MDMHINPKQAKLEAIRSIRSAMLRRMKNRMKLSENDTLEDLMADDTNDTSPNGLPVEFDEDPTSQKKILDTDGPEDLKRAVAEVQASEDEYDGETPRKKARPSHYR